MSDEKRMVVRLSQRSSKIWLEVDILDWKEIMVIQQYGNS